MTKKVLAVVIAAMMVLGSFGSVFAAGEPTLSFGATELDFTGVADNGLIEIPVYLDKVPQEKVSGIQFTVTWDKAKMMLASTAIASIKAQDFDFGGTIDPALGWTVGTSTGIVAWAGSSYIGADSIAEVSGKLCTLRFKRLAGATGTDNITITEGLINGIDTGTSVVTEYKQSKGEVNATNATVKFSEDVTPKSDNADITALKVTNGSEEEYVATVDGVDPQKYTVTVPSTVGSVTVVPTLADSKASVTAPASMESGTLATGDNSFSFTVTAEDGTTKKDYSLTITKEAAVKSSNAYLSALAANVGTAITFDKDTLTYDLGEVENSVDKVTITATAEDTKATVDGTGEKALAVGSNELKVVVTAEDGTTTKTYTINVTRKAAAVVGAPKIAVTTDKTEVDGGAEIVATVALTEFGTAAASEFELVYDKALFSYVKTEGVSDVSNDAVNGKVKVALASGTALGNTDVKVTFEAAVVAADSTASFTIANAKYGSTEDAPTSYTDVPAANITNSGTVTVKVVTDPVEAAKNAAKSELDAKIAALKAGTYYTDGITALDNALATGKTNIEAAATEADVTSAKAAAIAAMEAVKTKAGVDTDAKTEIATERALYADANYSATGVAALDKVVTDANAAIDALDAATKASTDVAALVAQAKTDLAAVKTLAQELADYKDAAKTALAGVYATYTASDYYTEDYAAITEAYNNGVAAIEAAADTAAVDTAKAAAEAAMAAVLKKADSALAKINDTTSTYSVQLFTDAGVTGAEDGKLAAYKLAVKDANKTLTLAEVQDIVTKVNALSAVTVGDVNKNGAFDAGDAALILKYIAARNTLDAALKAEATPVYASGIDAEFLLRADFNADGTVDASDAAAVLAKVLE